ncbi:unnamed protein product [Paramecium primaurelia]|uniref:Uncharacterized protein n=1 Tax=Paramecium primaurelia TaxID=5886 RepID=A0A8S1P9U4_PARPR|nr:unnamed protein product [Paramecium primaurelia]
MAFCQLSHFQYSRYNIYLQISVQNKIISELFQNQGFGLETYSKQHKNKQYKFKYLSELMINLFQKKKTHQNLNDFLNTLVQEQLIKQAVLFV